MTVQYYSSSDVGAPVLNNVAGSMVDLLDAVLVNGYGSKSSLGWTKPFTGTNIGVYKQGVSSNQRYMKVIDTDTSSAWVSGFETMTDINTGDR